MKLDLYKVDYANDKELEVYMKGSAYIVGRFIVVYNEMGQ